MAQLIKTNKRLNRRCQRAEKLIVKYRRRYLAIQNPAKMAQDRCERLARVMKELYDDMHREAWRACKWCKFRQRKQHWFKKLWKNFEWWK